MERVQCTEVRNGSRPDLRLSPRRLGRLINVHTKHLRDGIKRMVNGW